MLFGATGLVGHYTLHALLDDDRYDVVKVFVRRTLNLNHPKLQEVLTNFFRLEEFTDEMKGDDLFCCLGTTIKKAGSEQAFRQVDYEIPMRLGKLGEHLGWENFVMVSSQGANANSRFFYMKTKGEVERDLSACKLNHVIILRPSLLLGPRDEFRFGELIGKILARLLTPLMIGPLKKYRGIHARKVAKAMVESANQTTQSPRRILEVDEIRALGK